MCPTFISKDGEWYPAKEHAVLPHLAGTKNEVYDGPDRAALFVLYKEKATKLGMNFKQDPDFINRVRQLGYTMEDYLKAVGYDAEKVEKDFKEKASVVTMHELPKRVEEIEVASGGQDFSGMGNDLKGGWTQPPKIQ